MKNWISKIDNRLWAFGAGLVLVLLTGITNLVLHFFNRPDVNAIAQAVAATIKGNLH